MNINNYIKIHAKEDFKTFKFTEVDNLILALIPYLDLTLVVPKNKKIILKDMVKNLEVKTNYRNFFISKTYKMLKSMANTNRYGNIILYNYMRVVNPFMQFGAISMILDDKSVFVAYAGTDTSIIGWEEDFKMAYTYPLTSQKYAGVYLNKTLGLWPMKVRVGGHSKGGNLAVCAVINTRNYNKRKIINVYNNDGPGLLKKQIESKNYQKVKNKIKVLVPSDSIIGMILYQNDYEVVKAKSLNILQHDAFNWICDKDGFIKTKQNKRSKKLANRLANRLDKLSYQEKLEFVQKLFNVFKNNNITDAKDIKLNNILKIMKDFNNLDNNTKNLLKELLIIIFLK